MLHFKRFRKSSSDLENEALTSLMFHHLLHLFKSFSSYIDVVYGRWRWSQEHLELSPSWKHQHEVKTKMTVAVFIVMLTRDRLTVRSESVLKCWIPNMIWFWSLDARPWLNCSILSFLEPIETVSWSLSVIPGLPKDV